MRFVLCAFIVVWMCPLISGAKSKPSFKKTVQCFGKLIKQVDPQAGTLQYHTLPQTFVFPKNFLIDEDSKKQGFYLVGAKQTEFCPFNFSIPTYGVKGPVRSKFKLAVNGNIYDMTYSHKARKFKSSKSLLGSFMSRMPASTPKKSALKCKAIAKRSQKPMHDRIAWLIKRYGETFHKNKAAGKKAFAHKYKALIKPCQHISPNIDKQIKGFPGPKPKKTKYSAL